MNRARMVIVLILLIVLAVTLAGAFLTRGVMAYLPFLQARKGNWTGAYVPQGVVDQRPWQTAATLAALAQSAEEKELARDAERLADHEVDQAFSQSLRQASLAKPNLSGKALALQQRVTELQETIKNDQARIAALSAGAGTKSAGAVSNASDLEIAKAQLGLDQAELADSIEDLARESGDQRVKLQQELAARQAAMKQYRDNASKDDGQTAVASAEQYKTLAQQLSTWRSLRNRKQLIAQAEQLARADVAALTDDQERLKTEAAGLGGKAVGESSSERIERLQQISAQQNILSILNDRLGAQQQLVALYGRWGEQVEITAKDRSSPDIAVSGMACGNLHFGDPGGLGSPTGIGKDGSRSSPKADVENSSKSGNATGRPLTNPADHFRCTTADANDPGSGDRRTDRGLSGFHPGILRLVCFDGTKRSEG